MYTLIYYMILFYRKCINIFIIFFSEFSLRVTRGTLSVQSFEWFGKRVWIDIVFGYVTLVLHISPI